MRSMGEVNIKRHGVVGGKKDWTQHRRECTCRAEPVSTDAWLAGSLTAVEGSQFQCAVLDLCNLLRCMIKIVKITANILFG